MDIFINGVPKTVPSDIAVAQILDAFKITPATMVVEVNEEIVHPETYAYRCLTEGDRLEFIRFVGGG